MVGTWVGLCPNWQRAEISIHLGLRPEELSYGKEVLSPLCVCEGGSTYDVLRPPRPKFNAEDRVIYFCGLMHKPSRSIWWPVKIVPRKVEWKCVGSYNNTTRKGGIEQGGAH